MHCNLFKHARNKKDAIFPIIHPFQKRLENMQGRDKKKRDYSKKQESLKGKFWKEFSIFKAEQGRLEEVESYGKLVF